MTGLKKFLYEKPIVSGLSLWHNIAQGESILPGDPDDGGGFPNNPPPFVILWDDMQQAWVDEKGNLL